MDMSYSNEDLAAAQACFAMASRLLYEEPTVEGVADQTALRLFAAAPFGMDQPQEREGLERMDAWCLVAKGKALSTLEEKGIEPSDDEAAVAEALRDSPIFRESVDGLRREWLRLFVGLGAPEASCLESFYVEPNHHLFGKNTLAVREAYRRHGLQVERLHAEPDDHLGLMLGFVSRLIEEERTAQLADDVVGQTSLAHEQEAFLCEHVLPWLAPWRYAVAAHASSEYFLGLGDFVFGLIACYAARFSIAFDEETQAFRRSR